MSNTSFDNFGNLSRFFLKSPNLVSGRYKWMKNKYLPIASDIKKKLDLNKKNLLLDIGCGDSKISIILSKYVKKVVAIDHFEIIKKLKFKKNNKINYIGGNFLNSKFILNQKFDKIIVYSVIHYLKNKKEIFLLIKKCLNKLKINGELFIGDIPNLSKKNRFKKDPNFEKINNQWIKSKKKITKSEKMALSVIKKDAKLVLINDTLIKEIFLKYNSNKYETFVLDQNSNLPMFKTRIDIKIKKIF